MGKSLNHIQSIQDAYSKLINLVIVITDQEGETITEYSGRDKLVDYLLEHEDIVKRRKELIDEFKSISTPIIYDFEPGIKGILAPIVIPGDKKYFVWTSCIVDRDAKTFIHQYYEKAPNYEEVFQPIIEELVEVTSEEKQDLLEKIEAMCNFVSQHFTALLTKDNKSRALLFRNILSDFNSKESTLTSILNYIQTNMNEIDFIGIAEKKKTDYFSITNFIGAAEFSLLDKEFYTGEGLLGKVVATGEGKIWEEVSSDPRVAFFVLNQINPKSVFAFPIFRESEIIGILFGGSKVFEKFTGDFQLIGEMLSNIVSIKLRQKQLEEKVNQYSLQLTTFDEILQLMTNMNDVKRILFVLIDISINLMNTPFSCVIIKPARDSKQATVVSRGMNDYQINRLGRNIAARYFSTKDVSISNESTIVEDEEIGGEILLLPIKFREEIMGCLAIGVKEKKRLEETELFLSHLAMAAGVLIANQSSNNAADMIIKALALSTSQFNQSMDQRFREEELLIKGFYKDESDQEIKNIIAASSLKEIDDQILNEVLPDHPVTFLVKEFKQIKKWFNKGEKEASEYSKHSQFLFLIWLFIHSKKDLRKIESLTMIDASLIKDFINFITIEEVVEVTIDLSSKTNNMTENRVEAIQHHNQISKREKEVLELVIQGFSNKEIASKLFISDHTVKNHLTHIFQKLNVTDRAQAIAKVYQLSTPPNN
ncbi:LuxR C-terminal-related transcriptional regulator [Gracilibacillus xinjiangensis]|uniref:LuxR C-terminal-related transcriptional regulator n=1 Tax=Gracilibacillus xinjiangensis TaxID=1193282 RepID=A0ABV8WTL1_9BACI